MAPFLLFIFCLAFWSTAFLSWGDELELEPHWNALVIFGLALFNLCIVYFPLRPVFVLITLQIQKNKAEGQYEHWFADTLEWLSRVFLRVVLPMLGVPLIAMGVLNSHKIAAFIPDTTRATMTYLALLYFAPAFLYLVSRTAVIVLVLPIYLPLLLPAALCQILGWRKPVEKLDAVVLYPAHLLHVVTGGLCRLFYGRVAERFLEPESSEDPKRDAA